MGTTSLGQRRTVHPGSDAQEVDSDGRDDMLQVDFGKTSIAGATYSAASDRLGMGALYTRSCGIGLAEFLGLLSCSHLLESFMIFAGLESDETRFLLGCCALRS